LPNRSYKWSILRSITYEYWFFFLLNSKPWYWLTYEKSSNHSLDFIEAFTHNSTISGFFCVRCESLHPESYDTELQRTHTGGGPSPLCVQRVWKVIWRTSDFNVHWEVHRGEWHYHVRMWEIPQLKLCIKALEICIHVCIHMCKHGYTCVNISI
jgi:hypothetical protein